MAARDCRRWALTLPWGSLRRRARDEARAKLEHGIDLSFAKKEVKQALLLASESSFEAVARLWFNDWKANKAERHSGYVIARLEVDAFPAFGAKPVAELSAPTFARMARAIEARGAADIARRVLRSCGQVMRYAVAHGLAERNPVAYVKPGDVLRAGRQVNFARIELHELPELLRKREAYAGSCYKQRRLRPRI